MMEPQSIKVKVLVKQVIPTKVIYYSMKMFLFLAKKKLMSEKLSIKLVNLIFALAYWHKIEKGRWVPLRAKLNIEGLSDG